MIYGIINAFIGAFAGILYKKSLGVTKNFLSDSMYQFLGALFMLVFGCLGYFFTPIQIPNFSIILLLLSTAGIQIFSDLFEQYAYKNEKISTLAPFGETSSIFTIILGFILFQDTSIYGFIFALLAGILLFIGNLEKGKFKLNKYCISMSLSGLLLAIKMIIYGFILIDFTPYNVFFYNIVFVTLILFFFVLQSKKLSEIYQFTPTAVKYFSLENIFRLIYTVIVLFLIKNLGIIPATLIGMLFLYASVIFSVLFLKEYPSKKQISILILVSFCISLGMILK